jgi:hypothetical protein
MKERPKRDPGKCRNGPLFSTQDRLILARVGLQTFFFLSIKFIIIVSGNII